MKTRQLLALAAVLWLAGSAPAWGQAKSPSPAGDVPVEATSKADSFRVEKDRKPIPRDFVQQPPLIPHSVKGYNVTKNFNKCMDCHSWSRYEETGATKVSLTHFKDRDGRELGNISPRRYFCPQCHVPQTDAQPLVVNQFKPATGLRSTGAQK